MIRKCLEKTPAAGSASSCTGGSGPPRWFWSAGSVSPRRDGRRPGRIRLAPLCACLCVLACFPASPAGEDAGSLYYEGLVEALDVPSERRRAAVEAVCRELAGGGRDEMRAAVLAGLNARNLFVRLGAAEAMARAAEPGDEAILAGRLAVDSGLAFKTAVIGLFPAFFLSGDERSRIEAIDRLYWNEEAASEPVLSALRRLPVSRRGRLLRGVDETRTAVVLALVGQFDPVGAAIGRLGDPALGGEARRTVEAYAGPALGRDPSEWAALWKETRDEAALPGAGDIAEIRMAAVAALGLASAEGLPEALAGFSLLLSREDPLLRRGCMEALAGMCRAASLEEALFLSGEDGMHDGPDESAWRARRAESARSLRLFSAGEAVKLLDDGEPSLGSAAAACAGAACGFPAGVPDPGGRLAEMRAAATRELVRRSVRPGVPPAFRIDLARAMGEAGGLAAANALAELLASPYAAPEGGRDAMALAEGIVAALGAMAVSGGEGSAEAAGLLLASLGDRRRFPAAVPDAPPTTLGHLALWRLQRLARSGEISFDPELWARRLGWKR